MRNGESSSEDRLRVLVTNTCLLDWTGSELYVRDTALQLVKRGYEPVLYSPRVGKLGETLVAQGITVLTNLDVLEEKPDLIHGQHHLETMTALARFPGVPAIYFCHGVAPWEELPPIHPRIRRYVAVCSPVQNHLIRQGIEPERIVKILNFVDLERFKPRDPLPSVPKRALLFSNQASATNFGRTVAEACHCYGIPLDIVGLQNGNATPMPERLLRYYDLIFACGRAALESLAVGSAVICCDIEGLGPMVTRSNLEWLRDNNLGRAILHQPITVNAILREMNRYDSREAAAVSRMVRSSASADDAFERILTEYRRVLVDREEANACEEQRESASYASYFRWISSSINAERSRYKTELEAIKASTTWKLREVVVRMGVISCVCRKSLRCVRPLVKLLRSRSLFAGTPLRLTDWSIGPPCHPADWSIGQEFACDDPTLAGVVLSVSNSADLVGAVQSLLNQSEPVEVVVVNSGGGDPKATLLEAGINVTVLTKRELLYPGAARNEGIRATKAPFVAFLASDCRAERNWAEQRLKRHLCGWPVVSSAVTNRNRNLWSWVTHVLLFARLSPGTPPEAALNYGSSYARGLFNRYGLFREDLRTGEDSEFNDRIRPRVPILWSPEVKIVHLHPTSFWRLITDQFMRGKRMAESRALILRRSQKALVAKNAIARTPSSIRYAWKSAAPNERANVAGASLMAVPAAAAYAMGALCANGYHPGRKRIGPGKRPRVVALLVFHNEIRFIDHYFANITPLVDGIVAVDDGSTDGSGEFVRQQPSVLKLISLRPRDPHFWNEPRNHSLCIQAALEVKADWCIAVDADERLEKRFRERAEAAITQAEKRDWLAFWVKIRELWDYPDKYRTDGIWGKKNAARLFKARHDFEIDPRALHGHWAPLNSIQNGGCHGADITIYHLRMMDRNDREARMKRYKELDPGRFHQTMGYDYLTDEAGLSVEPIHQGREYEPLWKRSFMNVSNELGSDRWNR